MAIMSSTSPLPTDALVEDASKKQEAETESRKRKSSESEQDNHDSAAPPKNAKIKEGDTDGKNWKRIMANRKSARESRLRRIKYMETLEKSVEELTKENTQLLRENQAMARENFALRQQVAGISDASIVDPSSFRATQGLVMGNRAPGQGLLPGEGATSRLAAGALSPTRTGLAATRASLAGMDMPIGGHPLLPPVQDDQLALEMMRRRRAQASAGPTPEEEQQLLEMMRRRRNL